MVGQRGAQGAAGGGDYAHPLYDSEWGQVRMVHTLAHQSGEAGGGGGGGGAVHGRGAPEKAEGGGDGSGRAEGRARGCWRRGLRTPAVRQCVGRGEVNSR